jgi:hypothetical protein
MTLYSIESVRLESGVLTMEKFSVPAGQYLIMVTLHRLLVPSHLLVTMNSHA